MTSGAKLNGAGVDDELDEALVVKLSAGFGSLEAVPPEIIEPDEASLEAGEEPMEKEGVWLGVDWI